MIGSGTDLNLNGRKREILLGNTLDELSRIEGLRSPATNLQLHRTQEWSQHQEDGAKKTG